MSKIKRFFRQTGLTKAQLISSLLCYFLCFALFLGIVVIWNPLSLSSAPTEDSQAADGPINTSGYWTDTGRYDISWYNNPDTDTYGDGSESKPYKISTAAQLAGLSWLVYTCGEKGNPLVSGTDYFDYYIFRGKFFKQTENIDLSTYYWQPIGTDYDRFGAFMRRNFSGNYDGAGHTVSGVFTPAGSGTAYYYQGLFGYVGSSNSANPVAIQNLGVIDSFIQGSSYVGGVVGYAGSNTTISNCYNRGAVSGSDNNVGGVAGSASGGASAITNCYNTGAVTGSGGLVGGVVGHASNTNISKCYNSGSVSSERFNVGGVVGYAGSNTTISNCYNTVAVSGYGYVGGIVGEVFGATNITDCYNAGRISGTQDGVGGLVGYVTDNTTIEDSYNTGTVTGSGYTGYIGGIVGQVKSGNLNILNCYNTGDITVSIQDDAENIAINAQFTAGGLIGFFLGETNCQLQIQDSYNKGRITASFSALNANSDVTLHYGGIVGDIELSGTNTAVHIVDCYNRGNITGDTGTKLFAGGVVCLIRTSTSTSTATIERCYNSAALRGGVTGSPSVIGGIVSLVYCDTDSNVNLFDCFNYGSISQSLSAGGIVGMLTSGDKVSSSTGGQVVVSNCHNSGSVAAEFNLSASAAGIIASATTNGGSISLFNCFNAGDISVGSSEAVSCTAAGIVALNVMQVIIGVPAATIRNCYNIGQVSGESEASDDGSYSHIVGGISVANISTIYNCYYGGNCDSTIGGIGDTSSDVAGKAQYSSTLAVDSFKTKDWYTSSSNWYSSYPWDFDTVWVIDGARNSGYPTFKIDYWMDTSSFDFSWYENAPAGRGDTSSDPYIIDSAEDLMALAYLVYTAEGENTGNYHFLGKYFRQDADIDLSAYTWQPIGIYYDEDLNTMGHYFAANYDGNGHTISGITTRDGSTNLYSYQGLFGYVESSSSVTIQDITILDSNIRGYQYIGAIAGRSDSNVTISNCYNSSNITARSSYAGGIAGSSSTQISRCVNTGTITGSNYAGGIVGSGSANRCQNYGAVSGSSNVGGIAGWNGVFYSFNYGRIRGTGSEIGGITGNGYVRNNFNYGEVQGGSETGGIVGYLGDHENTANNCYNYGTISGSSDVGGIVGRMNSYNLASDAHVYIYNCINLGRVNGAGIVGRMRLGYAAWGVDNYAYVYNCYNLGYATGNAIVGTQEKGTGSSSRYHFTVSGCYFGANYGRTTTSYGGSYNSSLTMDTPKSSSWFTNSSNWHSSYPWDFSSNWTIQEGLQYPTLRIDYLDFSLERDISWFTDAPAGRGNSASNPYIISDAKDLAGLSWLVYSGNGTKSGDYYFTNKYFRQDADIDLSKLYWMPIGTMVDHYGNSLPRYFSGNYDGNGYTISGIYTSAGDDSGFAYQGLFGNVAPNGSDVTIQSVNISSSQIRGSNYVGGVVACIINNAINDVIIQDCQNSSTITGTGFVGGLVGYSSYATILDSNNSGSVSVNGNYAGGIVGSASNTAVDNCYNTGTTTTSSNYGGGLVGMAGSYASITNSYNTANITGSGNIVGGVAGYVGSTAGIASCYNTGSVSGASSVGGIVGSAASSSVVNTFNTGSVTGSSNVDGIAGSASSSTITNNYYGGGITTTMGSNGTYISNLADLAKTELFFSPFAGRYVSNTSWSTYWAPGEGTAWDFFTVWKIDSAQNNGYPIFRDEGETVDFWTDYVTATSFGGGNGKAASPYLISTPQHLALLAKNVNEGTSYENTYFRQTTNISLVGHLWLPIGQANGLYGEVTNHYFSGSYDGGGCTISGITTTMMLSQQGLFGAVSGASASSPAVIENVTVSKSSINGYDYVAGIAGYAQFANFDNCMNSASVTSAGRYTGGISGYISTVTIENCYNLGTVTGQGVFSSNNYEGHGGIAGYSVSNASIIDNCFNYGAVQGNYHVAGILGRNNATITNCYNFGDISGNGYVGGISGRVEASTRITNCHNQGNISSTGVDVGGICGLSRATITFTTSVGTLTGADNVGGIVGRAWQDVRITRSYFSGTIISTGANVAGILGTVDSNAGVHTITLSYNYAEFSTTNASVKGILGSSDSSTETKSTIQYCAAIIDGITVADIQGGTNVTDSNSYCVAGTNKELSTTTSGMDGNFAYISNFKDGRPIPLGIFHILDFGTKTGIENQVNAL